jgi:hypothetical protein
MKFHHLGLFAAKTCTSAQLSFSGFNSFSTVRRHSVLGRSVFLVSCGFHSSAAFVMSLGGFLSVCPTHFNFLSVISVDTGFWLVFSHRSWFQITSGHLLLIIIWRHLLQSRVSSGSTVSNYGLDDRAIGLRSPAGAKDFSSVLCVQTSSGAHPASCRRCTGGSFPRG